MYHTWIDGKEKTAQQLQWVKLQDNGVFVSCSEREGQGVILDGEIYHVDGRPQIDRPTVTLIWQEDTKKLMDTAYLTFVALAQAQILDDAAVLEHPQLFAEWNSTVRYKKGDICAFRQSLYRCSQDHTSQQDWTPEVAPSLWIRIGGCGEEWPTWAQPIGAHDAYAYGDQVRHMERHWTSDIDDNVWEPGVYGWSEVPQ